MAEPLTEAPAEEQDDQATVADNDGQEAAEPVAEDELEDTEDDDEGEE